MDFEDLRLCDLLDKVQKKAEEIAATRNVSQFKELGANIQAVYDYFVVSGKAYEAQQPMLKNLFSAFNYGAVIINDAIKTKRLDKEANSLLDECLQIITACCKNVKESLNI
ncbi:MAG: hypothetical protein ACI4QN_01875 [Candidatus Coproplasma sp.]